MKSFPLASDNLTSICKSVNVAAMLKLNLVLAFMLAGLSVGS